MYVTGFKSNSRVDSVHHTSSYISFNYFNNNSFTSSPFFSRDYVFNINNILMRSEWKTFNHLKFKETESWEERIFNNYKKNNASYIESFIIIDFREQLLVNHFRSCKSCFNKRKCEGSIHVYYKRVN